jgi:nicotinamide-nucleotide amidase
MNAIVLSIGDELVLGLTVDTNSGWLSRELAAIGWNTARHVTVGDDEAAIHAAIVAAAPDCDALLISGGLGPTKDDLTREALARALGQPLEINEKWLARMTEMFQKRGRPMPPSNRVQAMIPRRAEMIANMAGTAAGIEAAMPLRDGGDVCKVFVMPGVPNEMRTMFQRSVAPKLAGAASGATILTRTLHTFGLGESAVGEMLGGLMERSRNPTVGTTVANGVVSVRIAARSGSRREAEETLGQTVAQCLEVLGDLVFGAEEQSLPMVIAELLKKAPVRRVGTAESCTGGLLAKMLTDIAGSSQYFQRGWITYSNEAKIELLDGPARIIEQHGTVSEPTVIAMAESARKKSGSDFGLSISGIAGPDGGSTAKPVGTVCIALADAQTAVARMFSFPGNREMVRDRSAKMALTMLRYHLLGKTMPF